MNPSTALGLVVVDELVRLGVRHVVLSPGSRSAPLAYAVYRADAVGLLRLHVRVDERSAGFLALGLGKQTRVPAAVVTTSGTAVANLHPAVLEAHEAGVPLLVLTADRPPELRAARANQTTDQVGIFAGALRWEHDLAVPDDDPARPATWRTAVDRAFAAAIGWGVGTAGTAHAGAGSAGAGDAGPAHLNLPFREPLVADPAALEALDPRQPQHWPPHLRGRPDGQPWTALAGTPPDGVAAPAEPGLAGAIPDVPRTLVLLGDLPDPRQYRTACRVAEARGWPVLAEPYGERPAAHSVGGPLPHGALLADGPGLDEALRPERILVVGRLTLSRATAALLRSPGLRVEIVTGQARWPDAGHLAHRVYPWAALTGEGGVGRAGDGQAGDPGWSTAWQRAGQRLHAAIDPAIERSWPSGPAVARTVLSCLPAGATLFAGSSAAVRDLDLARHRDGALVVASRGLAGIDGSLSTAAGLALADPAGRRCFALVGDLTFLHDGNGLLIGPHELWPELTIVVVNDDGGGIFRTLEYGEPERQASFDRIFATPTRADLSLLCRAYRVEHELARTAAELAAAIGRPGPGPRVVEVPIGTVDRRAVTTSLHRVAVAALSATS